VRFIRCEDERGEKGCMPQNERPARWVFVRRESVSVDSGTLRVSWSGCGKRCKGIARGM
jgi:hypothetical protein